MNKVQPQKVFLQKPNERRCVLINIKAYVDSLENKGRAEKINETKSWHLK